MRVLPDGFGPLLGVGHELGEALRRCDARSLGQLRHDGAGLGLDGRIGLCEQPIDRIHDVFASAIGLLHQPFPQVDVGSTQRRLPLIGEQQVMVHRLEVCRARERFACAKAVANGRTVALESSRWPAGRRAH